MPPSGSAVSFAAPPCRSTFTPATLRKEGRDPTALPYLSPEQTGRMNRSVDYRADLYALGVIFYELLTGELPLGRFAAPSDRVALDVRIDDVVLKALEREPERRYQHASEVRTSVDRISASAPTRPISCRGSTILATVSADLATRSRPL